MYEAKLTDDKTNPNEIYEDIKKLLNKVTYYKLLMFYETLNIILG